MFTGLVFERGRLIADPRPSREGGRILSIVHSEVLGARLSVGASLAISGVCLTLVEASPESCAVELSPETLARTTLGRLRSGAEVNLEPALRVGDPLGGHWVQGHVDSTTTVTAVRELRDHRATSFALPGDLARFVVEKGSIAVDGVSLTVASLRDDDFEIAIIPHTLAVTTLGALRVGDAVNLEVDILGKYVARAVAEALSDRAPRSSS
ncbi:MAG TPA: riboflavin synthase [Thermoanaerobaculia bacterium]|nr:riboflavin synthase [Thermoanaerobaculia bacterium]